MNKLLSAAILAAIASTTVTAANATVNINNNNVDCQCSGTPISGSFALTIWNAATPQSTIKSDNQQALPTNPLAAGNPISKGIYTGKIDFSYDPQWWVTPTIAGFLNTAGGTYTQTSGAANVLQNTTISTGNFSSATLMEFSFTTTATLTTIVASHDDGISLFAAGSAVNLLDPSAAAPTTETNATLASLKPGTYNLWYEESNGVPADLCFDPANGGTATLPTPTPEPASIALLGFGLASVGFVRRRRSA